MFKYTYVKRKCVLKPSNVNIKKEINMSEVSGNTNYIKNNESMFMNGLHDFNNLIKRNRF